MAVTTAVSKRRASGGTDGGGIIGALPEELLHEVFSRVGGVKELFQLAVTCRRWLRLFTDPSFLRELCPGQGQGHRARLLGFLPLQRTSLSPSTFLPAPGSPLGPTERALTSFVADDDATFNYAVRLAARRGFVLMQLVMSPLQLGLFNPTTCERHVLPPLVECSSDSSWCVDGYAIVTAADGGANLHGSSPPPPPSGRFTFSQLLLITTRPGSYQRYLHSYSAATRRWGGAPTPFLDGRSLYLVGEGLAAVHRGAVHWLMCDDNLRVNKHEPQDGCSLSKLSVELGRGSAARVSLTELPVPVRPCFTPLLHVSRDGKLSVACMHTAHVTVWTQQDCGGGAGEDDDAAWVRTQVFQIPMVAAPNPTDPPGLRRWPDDEWHEVDRGSVLVLGRSRGVFVLDLEKEVMEKVMDCFLRLYDGGETRKCVPYVMDLVDFFVSRLGGLLCRG